MPSLNQSILGLVPLPIPPLSVQREIASVLGSFDDKIELNRQMNETLEAMARALFKSWFVDFDPVRAKAGGRQPWGMDAETVALFPSEFEESELGEIPKGWRVGRLSDIATAQRAALNPMEFPDEEFDHFSLPAFDDGRTPSREYGKAIKSNKLVVPSGSVLFSKLNPHIPRVWLTDTQRGHRSVASTEFVVLQCKSPFDRSYVYSLLAAPAFLAEAGSLVTGTTGSHQRIPPDSLLSLAVVLPDAGVSGRFGALAGPLLKCTVYNLRQSGTLAELRDTLLPKLLSGEVRVREAEPSVEAVG